VKSEPQDEMEVESAPKSKPKPKPKATESKTDDSTGTEAPTKPPAKKAAKVKTEANDDESLPAAVQITLKLLQPWTSNADKMIAPDVAGLSFGPEYISFTVRMAALARKLQAALRRKDVKNNTERDGAVSATIKEFLFEKKGAIQAPNLFALGTLFVQLLPQSPATVRELAWLLDGVLGEEQGKPKPDGERHRKILMRLLDGIGRDDYENIAAYAKKQTD
jgi:hypothetical protein